MIAKKNACDPAGISAITFDAAGTLLRPHPSVGAVYREVALRHGRDYAAADLDRAFPLAFSRASKTRTRSSSEKAEREFWTEVIVATISRVGPMPADAPRFCAELWETFARGSRWHVFPDVERVLKTLRSRGYTLGVLSNWDGRLHSVLAETGLRPFFNAVVISSEAGAEKPDEKIFRAAESSLCVLPDQCLHVGDSRKHDVDGARRSGWRALRVRHDDHACLDDEIPDLPALLDHLPSAAAKMR
jgi:putative hydrolase of the HAD superfamily